MAEQHTHDTEVSAGQMDKAVQTREKKQKQKKQKQQAQPQQSGNGQKPKPKVDRPLYQTLGEELFSSTRPELIVKSMPTLDINSISMPPPPSQPPSPLVPTPISDSKFSYFNFGFESENPRPQSALSLNLSRKSEDSTFSGSTKVSGDDRHPSRRFKLKGAVYKLDDFDAMNQIESLISRYGRVAHMGVRDPSYSFWMNRTRTAVVHFKVLSKVAVLGGDPLCHPDRLALSMQEFEEYCKQLGWKTAVIGASQGMASVAETRSWTAMHFGTETVLNPQTNEVLLGKSGKRIVVQCKQLLDPKKGGISVHTYCPSLGRDERIETELRNIYDDWRNARNATREAQAFITVFDIFAMSSLMTFLYTKDATGHINGFAALRKLGGNDGYHIDPFIQTNDAPRGTSDLLIYSSLAFLNAAGISYLSLGFEPLAQVGTITGLPSALHSTTRKVYKHVFGKIPVGGKEAFHARWKPDGTQETPLYLIFVGRIPSPRFMIAMTHYANISLRSIIKQDWQEVRNTVLKSDKKDENKDTKAGIVTHFANRSMKSVHVIKHDIQTRLLPRVDVVEVHA